MTNQTHNLGALAGALTPSGVFIVASENGSIVNPYNSNPAFAWMKVESSVMVTEGQFLRKRKRTALVKAETEVLNEIAASYGLKNALPGRIYVHEFLENELPEQHKQRFMKNKNGYEAAILDFVKVHGETKEVMTVNGQRIIRFSEWDMSGQMPDIMLSHSPSSPTAAPTAAPTVTASTEPAQLPAGDDEDLPF
jgi:hypothetical protein